MKFSDTNARSILASPIEDLEHFLDGYRVCIKLARRPVGQTRSGKALEKASTINHSIHFNRYVVQNQALGWLRAGTAAALLNDNQWAAWHL